VGRCSTDWSGSVSYRERWWALANAVVNFRVVLNAGNFLTS